MKNSTKKKLTLVKEILWQIYDTGAFLYEIYPKHYPSGNFNFPKRDRQTVYKTINRLKREGYLKEVESKGRKRYIATLKGKAKILALIKKDKKWDGKWRIVVFDVPERKRKIRDFFRGKLSEIGFRQLQESVWICPYNTADIVEELIELCEAMSYVHYLLVEELDNRDVLMELFKLKKK